MLRRFQMDNLTAPTFTEFILLFQGAVLVFIGLDALGLHIPVLRQLTCVIYLTFVPGLILLRILKLDLRRAPALVFVVGLSLIVLMGSGLLLNFILPILGISQPISAPYVVVFITIATLFLLVINYFKGNNIAPKIGSLAAIKSKTSPLVLLLLLLPFMSIIGSFFVNYYQDTVLLLSLVLLVALITLLVAFDRAPKTLYSLALFVMALSLLYHRSLISSQLWGGLGDIFEELYFSSLVLRQGFWNYGIQADYNAVLSVVFVPPLYSIYCNLDLVSFYKIIYPFLFAFVPLGLYTVFRKQMSEKIAFLSACLFIFGSYFYFENLPRQGFGEIFFVLLIFIIVSKDIAESKGSVLFVIFSAGLVFAHYASSYLFLYLIVASLLIDVVAESAIVGRISGRLNHEAVHSGVAVRDKKRVLRLGTVAIFFVLNLGWYLYSAGSSTIKDVAGLGNLISRNIVADFLNPSLAEGSGFLLAPTSSWVFAVLKVLYILAQIVIVVGVGAAALAVIFKVSSCKLRDKGAPLFKFDPEYLALSLAAASLLFAAIAVPYFSLYIGTQRLYQWLLMLLAPFFIYGIMMVLKPIIKPIKNYNLRSAGLKVVAIFLVLYLLFNSGFVQEVVKDPNPASIALSSDQAYLHSLTYTDAEASGAAFIADERVTNHNVYSDIYARQILRGSVQPTDHLVHLQLNTTDLEVGSYVYLSYTNIQGTMTLNEPRKTLTGNETVERPYPRITTVSAPFYDSLVQKSRIFDSGDSQILQ